MMSSIVGISLYLIYTREWIPVQLKKNTQDGNNNTEANKYAIHYPYYTVALFQRLQFLSFVKPSLDFILHMMKCTLETYLAHNVIQHAKGSRDQNPKASYVFGLLWHLNKKYTSISQFSFLFAFSLINEECLARLTTTIRQKSEDAKGKAAYIRFVLVWTQRRQSHPTHRHFHNNSSITLTRCAR